MPSLIATGYKDWNGRGKTNRDGAAQGWSQGTRPDNWKQYDDQAKRTGEASGIYVGRIPWQKKISGKLKTKCSSDGNSIKLGSQSWTVGRKNWWKNKKLYGEIEVQCQNKSGTLFLKWEGDKTSKAGWYGRVEMKN